MKLTYTPLESNALIVTGMATMLSALLILLGHAEAGAAIAGGVVGGVAKTFAGIKPGNGRKTTEE